jgi:hypothetical protein
MKLCAKINLYINAENRPTVQFEPTEEFAEMPPLHQAIMAHAGVQISMAVVKQIMDAYPGLTEAFSEHVRGAELQPGMPRPN